MIVTLAAVHVCMHSIMVIVIRCVHTKLAESCSAVVIYQIFHLCPHLSARSVVGILLVMRTVRHEVKTLCIYGKSAFKNVVVLARG